MLTTTNPEWGQYSSGVFSLIGKFFMATKVLRIRFFSSTKKWRKLRRSREHHAPVMKRGDVLQGSTLAQFPALLHNSKKNALVSQRPPFIWFCFGQISCFDAHERGIIRVLEGDSVACPHPCCYLLFTSPPPPLQGSARRIRAYVCVLIHMHVSVSSTP